jgi:hypothetical protein
MCATVLQPHRVQILNCLPTIDPLRLGPCTSISSNWVDSVLAAVPQVFPESQHKSAVYYPTDMPDVPDPILQCRGPSGLDRHLLQRPVPVGGSAWPIRVLASIWRSKSRRDLLVISVRWARQRLPSFPIQWMRGTRRVGCRYGGGMGACSAAPEWDDESPWNDTSFSRVRQVPNLQMCPRMMTQSCCFWRC